MLPVCKLDPVACHGNRGHEEEEAASDLAHARLSPSDLCFLAGGLSCEALPPESDDDDELEDDESDEERSSRWTR